MATINDIARHANVSKTTVSRVLNGRPEVDAETASRVRRVVGELGYVPNASARALAHGRADTIGLLIPSLGLPWIVQLVQGIAEVVEQEQSTLALHTMACGEASLGRFAAQVNARVIDGFVAVTPRGLDHYLRPFVDAGLPMSLIDESDRVPGLPRVWSGDRAGGASAGRHLSSLGRRRPIALAGPPGSVASRERIAGFRDEFVAAGTDLAVGAVAGGEWTIAGGRQAARELLDRHPHADAVFAANDLMAIGAMQALAESGRRVPDDVAVVGYDDITSAAHLIPALTTVRQPLADMARTAARAVLDARDGRRWEPGPRLLATELVVRESCGARLSPRRTAERDRREEVGTVPECQSPARGR